MFQSLVINRDLELFVFLINDKYTIILLNYSDMFTIEFKPSTSNNNEKILDFNRKSF